MPLIVAAVAAALGVAWVSLGMGRRIAIKEMSSRFASIATTVQSASFPLTASVLRSLSQLTETEWATLDAKGRVLDASLPTGALPDLSQLPLVDSDPQRPPQTLRITRPDAVQHYVAYRFARSGAAANHRGVDSVAVLFDKSRIDARARQAAIYPLLTGLSTVGLIALVMLISSSRLIRRIRQLELQVGQIAAGDFEIQPSDAGRDEIGRLAASIHAMGGQLKQLWHQVNRDQSAKLLHQISAGMAHQLRNTLTGAKLALQLHRDNLSGNDHEEVSVALRQIQIAEDYVTRLLAVGSSTRSASPPRALSECLEEVQATHQPIARHLGVVVCWQIDPAANGCVVANGSALTAAISNLLLNAMDAGDTVDVAAEIDGSTCIVTVSDNGPGVDPELQQELFEPFVTSKPEGMGLGLPLVARAAESLEGRIEWHRQRDRTRFQLTVPIERNAGEPIVQAASGAAGGSVR